MWSSFGSYPSNIPGGEHRSVEYHRMSDSRSCYHPAAMAVKADFLLRLCV